MTVIVSDDGSVSPESFVEDIVDVPDDDGVYVNVFAAYSLELHVIVVDDSDPPDVPESESVTVAPDDK